MNFDLQGSTRELPNIFDYPPENFFEKGPFWKDMSSSHHEFSKGYVSIQGSNSSSALRTWGADDLEDFSSCNDGQDEETQQLEN